MGQIDICFQEIRATIQIKQKEKNENNQLKKRTKHAYTY